MSSTNHKNKIPKDHYATPIPVVENLMKHLVVRPDDMFLEPCRAEGNIFNRVPLPVEQKQWAEIRDGVDYMTTTFSPVDLIITNPPFTIAEDFIEKCKQELKKDGTLVVLQKVNFLGSLVRVDFWNNLGFPNKMPVIIPRPSFTKGGTDSCEYCWFIWDYGNRFPTIPDGVSHLVTPPPNGKAYKKMNRRKFKDAET